MTYLAKAPVLGQPRSPPEKAAAVPPPPAMGPLSIIVPVLEEAGGVAEVLRRLAPLRERGAEVIVVDGGSRDDTVAQARPWADHVLTAPRGRASQMNAGARHATGTVLLFLHADTQLPERAAAAMLDRLAAGPHLWGRFDVRIEGRQALLPVIAGMMNRRSRLTGIATGDQAIFMRREAFSAVGGFPDIPLMEDIAISKRLKRLGRPLCIRERVSTSGRRWETHGAIRTILLMWRLRAAYCLGADPFHLARHYGYSPRPR